MAPSDWIVLTSVVVTGGIAGLTLWLRDRDAQAQRDHERSLTWEARNQERRGVIYVDLIATMRRLARAAEQIPDNPPVGFQLPPLIPEEELDRLEATLAAFGSQRVKDLYREWREQVRDFRLELLTWREMEKFGEGRRPSEVRETYGKLPTDQIKHILVIRSEFATKQSRIEEVVSHELQGAKD